MSKKIVVIVNHIRSLNVQASETEAFILGQTQ